MTSTLSFVAPLLLIGAIVVGLAGIMQLPVLDDVGRVAIAQVLNFLAVFGNGSAIEGCLVISLTSSLVGILFDTYAFYYRFLRNS